MWTPTTRRQHSRDDLRYGSDLSDAQWEIIAPFMPPPAKTGRPREWPMREIMNAIFIFYVLRAGCAWRMLPKDFPPMTTVYGWFLRFRREGLFETINHHLVMCSLNLLSVRYRERRITPWDTHRQRPMREPRDAASKAQHRLSVLELARELGNVAEVCRRRGMDRTSFYEWKRRFQTHGFEGLKDLPPIHKSHPQTTPPEVVEKIEALALEHPAFGCNRFEAMLALEGIRVSSITIQKILNESGLGTRYDRWLALEARHAEQAIELSAEQAAFLEKMNPCFRERHVESSAPGELLSADTFFVGTLKGEPLERHWSE